MTYKSNAVWGIVAALACCESVAGAAPEPAAAAPMAVSVRLGDLEPVTARQDWGTLQVDKDVAGGTALAIGGRAFAHGLGTHANSTVVYDLSDASYNTFTAWVGVDDSMKPFQAGSVVFQIVGDGKKLFDSGVMHVNDPAKQVQVPVTGVTELKLVVTDAGDGTRCDHADWAEAVLTGAQPEAESQNPEYEVKATGITVRLDGQGHVVSCATGHPAVDWALAGRTMLGDCRVTGAAVVTAADGGVVCTRKMTDKSGHGATVTDRFTPDQDSVRWDLEIASDGAGWTTPVSTQLACGKPEQKLIWTAWGTPDYSGTQLSPELAALVQAGKAAVGGAWSDPLAPVGFLHRSWHYGNVAQGCPVGSDYVVLPLFSILAPAGDTGISLVLSPEDVLLNMDLAVWATGRVRYARTNYRLGGGQTVKFTMHLVGHEASWRGGLRWITQHYPQYFEAPNPRAHQIAGCGAYSTGEQPLDVGKFKKMAFGLNWKLSDDFPYMGMFIPPVKDADEKWTRSCDERSAAYKGKDSSCRQMNDYAKYMKQNGFSVLSYFNVTEFGKNMYGRQAVKTADDPLLWQDPAGFIKYQLPQAIVDPNIGTCYRAYVVDPGDPDYLNFMLEQAARNTQLLPDTDGICIDRADWLRLYNPHADDGVSWVEGKPARSLFRSWISLMARLGPQMHQADKVIFANMMTERLELCRQLDGIYTEFGNNGNALNAAALLGVRKPVLCWTYNETLGQPNPDAFMQRHLHMGCFPTAPYPWNNHCINPEAKAEQLYIDYGPLLDALRGKKWVLAPHCVATTTPNVKVNLFEVPGGYALPVTFGGTTDSATVQLRNIPGLAPLQAAAVHPGASSAVPVAGRLQDGVLTLTVPLVHGCAMVKLSTR